jgi:hypothetical protein
MIDIIVAIIMLVIFAVAGYGAILLVRDKQIQWEQRRNKRDEL